MKKLTCFFLCMYMLNALHAQIVRPFAVRYNNPSVRGNIVYVSNSIISTSGSTGTSETPPGGTTTNNSGAGVYIDIDDPAAVPNDTFFRYNSTANIWKYWSNSLANAPAATWITTGFSDAAWTTGLGSNYHYNDAGGTDVGFGPSNTARYPTVYFRRTVTIANTASYTGFVINLRRDDGAAVYVNGTEVHRSNLIAGATYSTLGTANVEGTDEYVSFTLPISAFVNGSNTIAVEIHNFNTGRNPAGETELNFDMELVGQTIQPVDNSGTFSSSTADLSLASCSKVLWAGLYWGTDQGTSGTNSAWMTGAETSVKLKIPGSSSFQAVAASVTGYHNSTSSPLAGFNHTGYACFAEITSLINTTSPNGTYTIADVLGPAGINNAAGGWTIVIVYENPSLAPRNLSVFDGHVIIDGGAAPTDINITGFLTPPTGTVSCELGGIVYDGDRVSQDAFQFKQGPAASFFDLALTSSYALNGNADAWNSKISYKGAIVTTRSPAYNNTLGYDATIMDLPNTSNTQLGNNVNTATVRFSSPSENYIVQVLTTSISQYAPEFAMTKSSTDLNGGSLVGSDIIRYRIDYQNVGNDASLNSYITDNIPTATGFVPGTIKINGVAKTDASGDDQAEYDYANRRVVFRIGTGANAASGGSVASLASGYVEFDVYAASSCEILNCGTPTNNIARIDYTGQSSGLSLYDSSGYMSGGCLTSGPISNTITGSCFIPRDTILVNQCPSTTVMLPAQLLAGYTFYTAMPFISANVFNYTNAVTQSGTYYAYFNSGGSCHDTIVIRVYINPCPDIDDDNDGIPDYIEGNISGATGDHDSDGTPNYTDAQYPGFVDYNSDGINDNFDPSADADNDNTPNFIDANFAGFTDANGDGVNDNFDWDLDGIPNQLDVDSDNDGIPDVVENFGVDTNGDGRIDNYTDTDNDGLSQNVDANNAGAVGSGSGLGATDTDADGIPNYFDHDSDNDGLPDVLEAYGTDANNNGVIDNYTDLDGDGFSDNIDGDAGNDGTTENASNTLLRTGADGNNDGRCDTFTYNNIDSDTKPNPYELDSDMDGIADLIEAGFPDTDNNGQADGSVNSKGWSTTISALGVLTLTNTDGTGRANVYDIDSDDDGIPDNIEGQATASYVLPIGTDTDGDGMDDGYDNISGFGGRGVNPIDYDGDNIPDYLDSDADSDGQIDRTEGNDFNLNQTADDNVALTGVDTDGDGLDDRFDSNNSSAEGTSAYMGSAGSFTGDASAGSYTMVQRSNASFGNRDWRWQPFILPCSFIEFKGRLNGKNADLEWSVICKQEIEKFIIERSTDNNNYKSILNVSGHNTPNEVDHYNATDNLTALSGNEVYYRLISIAKNGQVKYSPTIKLILNGLKYDVQLSPVPAKNNVQVSINVKQDGTALFLVIDAYGRVVKKMSERVKAGSNSFTYNNFDELPNGSYYLNANVNGQISSYKFQVIR